MLEPALQRLTLYGMDLSAAAISTLFMHRHQLVGLRCLAMCFNQDLDSRSLVAVAGAGWALQRLVIDRRGLTCQAAAALAALPSLERMLLDEDSSN